MMQLNLKIIKLMKDVNYKFYKINKYKETTKMNLKIIYNLWIHYKDTNQWKW